MYINNEYIRKKKNKQKTKKKPNKFLTNRCGYYFAVLAAAGQFVYAAACQPAPPFVAAAAAIAW